MVKAVMLLVLIALLTLGAFWFVKKSPPPEPMDDFLVNSSSPVPQPQTLGLDTTIVADASEVKQYLHPSQGFKIKYPTDVSVKSLGESTVLFRDGLRVEIVQGKLSGKDTINTVAERDINAKMEKLGEKFKLIETISPVSIGFLTGITYTSEESSREITYFYVPQDSGYLLLTNSTDTSDTGLLSASDDIIYSLELF